MNPKIKAEWLKALRSGKYKQCQGRLARDTGYCCLGVLYDITADGWWMWDPGLEWTTSIGNDHGRLPEEIAVQAGLDIPSEKTLATMNDNGKTFHEIADYIERNL